MGPGRRHGKGGLNVGVKSSREETKLYPWDLYPRKDVKISEMVGVLHRSIGAARNENIL